MKEVNIKDLKEMVSVITKARNVYYSKNVSMQYSFDSLRKLIEEERSINLKAGDVFVCDSANGKSRKALLRIDNGWLILYYRLDRHKDFKFVKQIAE